jgi:hypothetical protein
MVQDLDIGQFFRRSPREWLRRYFEQQGVLNHLNWASVKTRNIEPLMEAWLALDADLRGRMVEDFSNIKLLATPVGKVQIIDEAAYHGKQQKVSAKLAELDDFYDCAFWTFCEQPDCWNGAIFYAAADGKPKRYWRKRINMPRLRRHATPADGMALGAAITDLFRQTEGRGDYCAVRQSRRRAHGEKEYYFAYPQDHRQMAIEYNKGEMTRRPHKPAFEIIFIHDDTQQTLSIWHEGKKERVNDLQVTFAKAVLGQDIPRESPRDDRVYDLDAFLDPGFIFKPRSALGIARVDVRKIGIRVLGAEPYSFSIHLGDKTPGHILHQRLKAATSDIRPSALKVSRVGMRVTFDPGPRDTQPKTRSFELAWPNSCSLQNDSRGLLIQRMLAEHGIEPKWPTDDKVDGGQTG